jgi:hypothetical protein
MSNPIPLREAAAVLGVSVDALRARIRRGTVEASKVSGRWLVDVQIDDQDAPRTDQDASSSDLVAQLTADNEALRRELADVRGRQRAELERLDAALATMATMARALPAPPTDPPRRRRRWPWQREAR